MIFDGHGSHNPDNQTSPIVVGGSSMDVWLYRNELKVPPIIVLSACDTAPLDGAHGSTAVGFLNAGVPNRYVLATGGSL
jgi:CHAT domain-containing protein